MSVIDRATLDLINLIRSQQGANARQSNQMRGNEIIGQGILRGTENAVAGLERGRNRQERAADRASDAQYRQQQLDAENHRTDLMYGQRSSDNGLLSRLAAHQTGQPLRLTQGPRGDESDFFAPERQPGDIEVTGRESPETMRYAVSESDRVSKENQKLQRAEKQRQAMLADAKTPEDINVINSAGPDELDNLITAKFAHSYKDQHDQAQAQAGAEMTHTLIESGAWGTDPAVKHILHGRTDAWVAGGGQGNVRELHSSFDNVVRPRAGQMTDTQRAQRAQEVRTAWSGIVPEQYMPALIDSATHGVPYTSIVTKAMGEAGGDQKQMLSVLRERRANAQARLGAAIYDEDPNVRKAATDDLKALTDAHDAMMQKMLPGDKKADEPKVDNYSDEEMTAAVRAAQSEGLSDKAAIKKRAQEILKGGK